MTTSRLVRAALPLAVALSFLAFPALAADPAPRLQVSAGGVLVDPVIAAPAYQLRVIGPDGSVFEDTHLDGEPLLILPKQFGQSRWLDGSYRYELVPVLGVRQRGFSWTRLFDPWSVVPDRRPHALVRVIEELNELFEAEGDLDEQIAPRGQHSFEHLTPIRGRKRREPTDMAEQGRNVLDHVQGVDQVAPRIWLGRPSLFVDALVDSEIHAGRKLAAPGDQRLDERARDAQLLFAETNRHFTG